MKLVHTTAWMNLQGMMLSEKNPIPKCCTLYYYIHIKFLKWQNYRNREWTSDCRELKINQRRRCRRQGGLAVTGGIFVVMVLALCLDCLIDSMLVVILYYKFSRCYPWEKLGKEYTGSFCVFSYNMNL